MHAHLFLEIPDFNHARIQELSAGVKDQLAEKVCQRFFFFFSPQPILRRGPMVIPKKTIIFQDSKGWGGGVGGPMAYSI